MNTFAKTQSLSQRVDSEYQTSQNTYPLSVSVDSSSAQRSSRQGSSSNDSFVCNVSDDEVIERDVDLEIEARIRSETLQSTDPGMVEYQQKQWLQRDRAASRGRAARTGPSTLSQRMLSTLQRKKNRTAANDTRSKRTGTTTLQVVPADGVLTDNNGSGSNHSMGADIDGLVVADPFYDPSQDPAYMSSDDEHPSISHSITSCSGRLEARISERLLQNKSSLSGRPDSLHASPVEGNELSVRYTNRRTYPAEAAKKVDQRFSVDDRQQPQPSDKVDTTRRRAIRDQRSSGEEYHQRNGHQDAMVETNLDANKSLPLAFHFQGKPAPPAAPVDSRSRPHLPVSMSSSRRDLMHASHQAPEPPRQADAFTSLSSSIDQIDQVVTGLENCFMAATVSSLAAVALRELELLRIATKQVRTNGTTLILAEIGRPQSQMVSPFRRLVARAAGLQGRIETLISHVKTML